MMLRQSDLKTWARCPLQWRYENIDMLPREESSATVFGTIMHECVLLMEKRHAAHDIAAPCTCLAETLAIFKLRWADPDTKIDYYLRGASWKKYYDDGVRSLKNWWAIIEWDADVVVAREYTFTVGIEGSPHKLTGTLDKLAIRYRADINAWVVLVSDYKTNKKPPTYNYLAQDLQFSAYCYATTRPEFWTGIQDGAKIFAKYRSAPRWGEWVALMGPKRMDAGERTQQHFNRLTYAINSMADSIAMRIFVPNISGETCAYCEHRTHCGLPTREQEGLPA